jgi:ribosomal protein S18 acetylase RimI-like enzyme
VTTTDLEFAPATAADSDRIAGLILGTPDQITTRTAMRLLGITDFDKTARLWRALLRPSHPWRRTTLARSGDDTVGILMTAGPLERVAPGTVLLAVRLFGPLALLRFVRRIRIQERVNTARPAGAFGVSELHVAPAYRNRGVGAALLAEVERQARVAGHTHVSLQVLTANPAKHLYDRAGFEVIATRTDPDFERLTGVAGNHRMLKRLD